MRLPMALLLLLHGAIAAAPQPHLIIQGFPNGCGDTASASDFWLQMKDALEQAFTTAGLGFSSVTCPKDLTEEAAAVASIVQANSGLTDITIVAALVQGSHCVGTACPAEGLSNDGTSYKSSLLAGATHVWLEVGVPDMSTLLDQELGGFYDPNYNVSSIVLTPNNYDGGLRAGAEFCERTRATRPQTLALLYGESSAAHSTARINGFKDHVNARCSQHTVSFEGYANWNQKQAFDMASSIFLRDTAITAVVAANDDMAIGTVKAAVSVRPWNSSGLIVFGYDHSKGVEPYLASGEVSCTIDQLAKYPDDGLVYTTASVVAKLNALKEMAPYVGGAVLSSKAIIEFFGLGTAAKIETSTSPFVTDMQQYVARQLMQSYRSSSRPVDATRAPVNVSVGLHDVSIIDFESTTGSMTMVGWLTAEWSDDRLRWNTRLWNDVLDMATSDLWAPTIYIQNTEQFSTIFEPPSIVFSQGIVRRSQQIRAQTRCDTVRRLQLYPFDTHDCSVSLRVTANAEQVELWPFQWDAACVGCLAKEQLAGWSVAVSATAIRTSGKANTTKNAPEPSAAGAPALTSHLLASDNVQFGVKLGRRSQRMIYTIFMPATFVNMIGLSTFWLDGYMDSVLMAPLAFLALMTLHASDTSKVDSEDLTYFDNFYLISAAFHIIAFFFALQDRAWGRDATKAKKSLQRFSISPESFKRRQASKPSASQEDGNADTFLSKRFGTLVRVEQWFGKTSVLLPEPWATFYVVAIGGENVTKADKHGRRLIVPV